MPLISDPDSLNDGTEISINTATRRITLSIAGNLSTDGVTLQCVYSKLKELWRTNTNYIKFPFPMVAITEEKFELVNSWDFFNTATKQLIRTGGWALKNASNVSLEEWAGVVTLGSIGGTDQVYYQQSNGGSATNIVLTGAVNQAIQVFGGPSNGNFDFRSYLKLFVRTYQKSYSSAQLSDIGVTTLTYQVYRFPLANASDLKVIADDTTVDGSAPYTGMSITWYASDQTRSIGGTNRTFRVIINGNSGTAEQIYTFVQRQLRRATDIDSGAGTKTGRITTDILRFVGDTLFTLVQSEGGVFIDNYQAGDINRLTFADNSGTNRTFPYTATVTLQFNSNLTSDPSARYWVYFTNDDAGDNTGRDFGANTAILVQDASASTYTGNVSSSSIQRTYSYDSNVQRGNASAGTDVPITGVAIGLSGAQYITVTGTITRSTGNVLSFASAQERNYLNP